MSATPLSPDHIDVEPAESELSDTAIESLASLLVDVALADQEAAEAA